MTPAAIAGPRIVLGGNAFGWTADETTSFAILDAFAGGGGVMIDTADVYSAWVAGNSGGESERIIGAWLKTSGKRHAVKIHSKVGMMPGGLAPKQIAAGKIAEAGASNFTAERLQAALDIDTPYRVFQPEYNLAARGTTAEQVRANRGGQINDFMVYDAPLQKLCVAHDIAVLPYFGLASGFLTGKYRSRDTLAVC